MCSDLKDQDECKNYATHSCDDCLIQDVYCKYHSDAHYLHFHSKVYEISGLRTFKKQIKACIINIANDSSIVMAEIRRVSINTITQLKQANMNVKNINDLKLISFDTKKNSLLIEQAKDIDMKIEDTTFQNIENTSNLLIQDDVHTQSKKSDIDKLDISIQDLTLTQMSRETYGRSNTTTGGTSQLPIIQMISKLIH